MNRNKDVIDKPYVAHPHGSYDTHIARDSLHRLKGRRIDGFQVLDSKHGIS